jgi:hypothetical protein
VPFCSALNFLDLVEKINRKHLNLIVSEVRRGRVMKEALYIGLTDVSEMRIRESGRADKRRGRMNTNLFRTL